MSPTWYTFAQADKEFKPFEVTVTINKNENTLEMLEAEVCHNDEEGLDSIKEGWYGQRHTYRWKGLFNDEEITYTFNTETDVGEIRGEIPDRNILKDYLFLACYRNGISIPGNFPMVNNDEEIAKMISVMNDYSYEEYYDSNYFTRHEDGSTTPKVVSENWPQVLGYNVNTFHPKTVAERKAIAECNHSHIKITHGIDYKHMYKVQLGEMRKFQEFYRSQTAV